jgi:hypothetical protein
MSQEKIRQACAEIETCLDAIVLTEHGPEPKAAFDVCRILQGVTRRHGLSIKSLPWQEMLETFAETNDMDYELLVEGVVERWNCVAWPEGTNPIQETAAAAREGKIAIPDLPGKWPGARFKKDAGITILIFQRLTLNGARKATMSCRQLAEALGCDPFRASRLLRALIENGHVEPVGKPTRKIAQGYRLPLTECDIDT